MKGRKVKHVVLGEDVGGGGEERGWRRVNMVDVVYILVWKWIMKPVVLGGGGVWKDDGGGESNRGTL
jgi:hypothetical protein